MGQRQQVLVVGGTRGTGLLIVQLLLRDGYRVRVLARNPAQATARLGSTVDVIPGNLTRPETLSRAVRGATHVIFTAGVAVGPAREKLIIATEYEGVLKTLAAARSEGFSGRFLYMTSIGVTRASLTGAFLRAGFLLNSPGGRRAIELSQAAHPLAPKYRIARADVAETFVEALKRPNTSRTTFDVVWGRGSRREAWDVLFDRLKPDA